MNVYMSSIGNQEGSVSQLGFQYKVHTDFDVQYERIMWGRPCAILVL